MLSIGAVAEDVAKIGGAILVSSTIAYQGGWKRMYIPTRNWWRDVKEKWTDLLATVKRLDKQVQILVDDSKNNDGSTSKDRSELMYAELKVLGAVIGETTPVATLWGITDSKGVFVPVRVSDAFVKLTGMGHEQTANDNWLNFVDTPDSVRVAETYRVAMERGYPFQIPYTLCNIGTERKTPVVHYGDPVRNSVSKKIIGWVWEIFDASEPAVPHNRRATDGRRRELAE